VSNSSSSSFVVSYHKPHNAIGEFAKNFDWVKDTDKLTFAHLKEHALYSEWDKREQDALGCDFSS